MLVPVFWGAFVPASLRLLPRQAVVAPSAPAVSMMALVELPFEAVQHVVDLLESRLLQRAAGIHRAITAAADQHHRLLGFCRFLHLRQKLRIDLPIRRIA